MIGEAADILGALLISGASYRGRRILELNMSDNTSALLKICGIFLLFAGLSCHIDSGATPCIGTVSWTLELGVVLLLTATLLTSIEHLRSRQKR